jgi:hypothetical protein
MNKGICIISLLLSLFLCSCSANSALYHTQEEIKFNYNNISAYNDFWLTNESVCYLDDSLIQNYYILSEKGKSKISSNSGYGFGVIQNYGSKIYMLDECKSIDEYNSMYLLKVYDVESGKLSDVATIKNCDNFLILNEYVFYLQYNWTDNSRRLSLRVFRPDSGEHFAINDAVLSFGVIGSDLFYASEEDNKVSVFRYDVKNDLSVSCGGFLLDTTDIETFKQHVIVSYVPNYIMFTCSNYQDVTSTIWKFSLEEKNVSKVEQNFCITNFISYDQCSYFTMFDAEEENVTQIYKMANDTNETVKIGEIEGECSLFVGSDEGVYVLQYNENVLRYLSNQCTSKTVCKF